MKFAFIFLFTLLFTFLFTYSIPSMGNKIGTDKVINASNSGSITAGESAAAIVNAESTEQHSIKPLLPVILIVFNGLILLFLQKYKNIVALPFSQLIHHHQSNIKNKHLIGQLPNPSHR